MKTVYAFLIAFAVLALVSINGITTYATKETVSLTVQSKERITDGSNSKYLVFTDGEVFENTDNWWVLKFNSSDVYGQLREGATCQAVVSGWRIPFFSSYRNILSVTC